jgi:hypothetical protein
VRRGQPTRGRGDRTRGPTPLTRSTHDGGPSRPAALVLSNRRSSGRPRALLTIAAQSPRRSTAVLDPGGPRRAYRRAVGHQRGADHVLIDIHGLIVKRLPQTAAGVLAAAVAKGPQLRVPDDLLAIGGKDVLPAGGAQRHRASPPLPCPGPLPRRVGHLASARQRRSHARLFAGPCRSCGCGGYGRRDHSMPARHLGGSPPSAPAAATTAPPAAWRTPAPARGPTQRCPH